MDAERKFSDETVSKLDRLTDEILSRVLELPEEQAKGKTGAMVRVLFSPFALAGRTMEWNEVYSKRVGARLDDNWESVETFSAEKASRLAEMQAKYRLHVSSWQSRDVDNKKYGGAFLVLANVPELGGDVLLIISVSGLTEAGDETYGLLLANAMSWGNGEWYAHIVMHSRNHQALRFFM